MFGLLKARKARKAASAAITPFVCQTRQRLGDIPDSAWSNAYVIGYIGTLITLFAERNAGGLGDSLLASVQADAWSDITQSDNVLIGEEICFLSTADDGTFNLGCRNATSFFVALDAANTGESEIRLDASIDVSAEKWTFEQAGRDSCSGLWMQYFDAHLGRGSPLDAR
jgi:hypothetical protein